MRRKIRRFPVGGICTLVLSAVVAGFLVSAPPTPTGERMRTESASITVADSLVDVAFDTGNMASAKKLNKKHKTYKKKAKKLSKKAKQLRKKAKRARAAAKRAKSTKKTKRLRAKAKSFTKKAKKVSKKAKKFRAKAKRIRPGSVRNPYAVGKTFAMRGWKIKFGKTDPNAWPRISRANSFNTKPKSGFSYVMAPVTYTYVGPRAYEAPAYDTDIKFRGSDGRVYGEMWGSHWCGIIPNDAFEIDDLARGGRSTGNVCAVVPTKAVSGGMWRASSEQAWRVYRHARIR